MPGPICRTCGCLLERAQDCRSGWCASQPRRSCVTFRPSSCSRPGRLRPRNILLLVGRRSDIAAIEGQLAALMASLIPLPPWLPASIDAAKSAIAQRPARACARDASRQGSAGKRSPMSSRSRARSAISRCSTGFTGMPRTCAASERLAWITGWTNDPEGAAPRPRWRGHPLRSRLADAPAGTERAHGASNPSWVRGFEIFARMLGTPARDESDPSVILAVIVPLIFGFMFGDVGQGLVILVAGLVLGRRFPCSGCWCREGSRRSSSACCSAACSAARI